MVRTAEAARRVPKPSEGPPGSPGRDRSVNDDDVLDVATELFLMRGPSAVSMVDLARLTRVSRASLYRRWPNVLAVLRAVASREFEAALNKVVSSRPMTRGDDVVEVIVALVSELRSHRLLRALIDEEPTFFAPYLVERPTVAGEHLLTLVRPMLDAAIAAGTLRPPDNGDSNELAKTVLLCAISFLFTGPLVHDSAQVDTAFRHLLERLLLP